MCIGETERERGRERESLFMIKLSVLMQRNVQMFIFMQQFWEYGNTASKLIVGKKMQNSSRADPQLFWDNQGLVLPNLF